MRESGKKSKVVGSPTIKLVKPQVTKLTSLEKLLDNIRKFGI